VAESEPRRLRTVVHLTQAHTYGPLAPDEDAGTLSRERCMAHLADVVGMLEWLAASVADEAAVKCFVLVDCLHLTACLRPGVVGWDDMAAVDERLAALGCRLLLLDGDDTTVRERAVRARWDSEFIQGYGLRRFGPGEADLVAHFQRERDTFRDLFSRSALAKLRIPSEAPEAATADAAFRFWRDDLA
jgi:hypothetical protein